MPAAPTPKKPRNPWAYLSIKYKLACTSAIMVVVIALLLHTVFSQSTTLLQAAYDQSSEYYNINSLQQHFIDVDSLLQTYLSNVSSRSVYQAEWENLNKTIQSELNALNTNTDEITLEQYFLANALQTGYTSYAASCDTLVAMGLTNASTLDLYAQYEVTTSIYAHLQDTALLLQTATLTEGQSNLSALRAELSDLTSTFSFFAVILCFLFLFLVCELIQVIVVPILRLAEASTAVRDGNFDTPDIELSNRDELHTLALSFNEMKRHMKSLFLAMQRQTEMEQALYQKELESQKTSALLAEAQMQQLRNQINPHFLFNTLNIISRTARIEQASKTEKLILALARLFRYGLKTDADQVPLSREINIVNDYIAIQSSRFGGRVFLRWRIAGDVNPDEILVPTFLLQPIVENAVIHGLEPKLSGGGICIRVLRRGDDLHLTITDNGVGMTEKTRNNLLTAQQSHKGHLSGIGVGNVRSRLQLLYPSAIFAIHSRPQRGTQVKMVIPNAFLQAQEEVAEDA